MKCGGVIIDNRDIGDTIERHQKFLPDNWDCIHIKDIVINDLHDYNRILGSLGFWEKIPFDKVLIFQQDSGLLKEGIEQFLECDYVGAPFQFQEHGGNGGLSLRTKQVMIDTIKIFHYDTGIHGNEDVYFSNHITDVGGKLAPRDVCHKFSVESILHYGTLGYHAIDRYFDKETANKIKNQYI